MLHCLHLLEDFFGNSTGMSVLERQRATLEWLLKFQQQPLLENHVTTLNNSIDNMMMAEQYNYLPDFANFSIAGKESGFVSPESWTSSLEVERSLSTTSGRAPAVLESAKMKEKVVELKDGDVSIGKGRLNKRNAESVVADECKAKRIKGEEAEEDESYKASEKSCREASSDSSKDNNSNSKAIEVQKPDFIHVRARRGQATDSHSLAERARREKINKKMKYLQDLVPGCSKIVGKAGMLDEIINYVQSLQSQVEFLSMKLAAINPKMEFNIDNLFGKEFPAYVASFPTAAPPSEMAASLPYLEQQGTTSCELDVQLTNPPQNAPQSTTTSSVSVPDQLYQLDSSCFSQVQPLPTWDSDLQRFYNVGFH